MTIKAVLFDVDDTLFDYRSASRAGILGYLASLGELADDATHDRWHALELTEYARFLTGELTFQGQRRERVRGMVGRPLTDTEADAWFTGYRAQFEAAWATFADVRPALDALADYRLGVLSNSDTAYQQDKLTRLGIGAAFVAVVGVDVAGSAKPEAAAFHAGCAALGAAPEETAYVGDLLDIDALGAVAAGLQGIWLDRHGTADAPAGVRRIKSLAELPVLLVG